MGVTSKSLRRLAFAGGLAAAGATSVALAAVAPAPAAPRAPGPGDATIKQAFALVEPRYEPAFERNCSLDAPFPLSNGKGTAPVAAKLFDNFFYVGRLDVGAWVIKTTGGLILVDTLYNPEEAEKLIVPNMRKLGLDPDQIKMVLITHSHVDHAGGMSYFQKKGIPVMISEKDWGPVGGAPNPAAILRDNQVITLGDTKVTVIYTPGHSPGAVTFVFPVFEHGKRHMAALMGGVGPRGDVTVHQTAIETLGHMLAFGRSVGMDVLFQPHEIMEDPVAMQYVLDAAAHPGVQPNAYILGEKRLQDYGQMLTTCWKARIEIMQSGHAPVGRGAGAPQ